MSSYAQEWCPGVQYNHGSRVMYQGVEYEIIQPHRSQSDWAPPATPALWGRTNGSCNPAPGYGAPQGQVNHFQQPQSQQGYGYQAPPPQNGYAQPPPSYNNNAGPNMVPSYQQSAEPEKKNNGFMGLGNISTGAAIAGGLVGATALAGAAVLGANQYKKHQEQKTENAWNASEWQMNAQKRTHEYHTLAQQGRAPPVAWVLTSGNGIPPNAIQCGRDSNGEPLFAARCPYRGGVHVGKVARSFNDGAHFSWGGDEVTSREYEILVGNPNAVKWVEENGHCNSNNRFVEGGFEDNKPLFIGQASKNEGMHPGKCGPHLSGCAIGYGGKEHVKEKYRVLVYA